MFVDIDDARHHHMHLFLSLLIYIYICISTKSKCLHSIDFPINVLTVYMYTMFLLQIMTAEPLTLDCFSAFDIPDEVTDHFNFSSSLEQEEHLQKKNHTFSQKRVVRCHINYQFKLLSIFQINHLNVYLILPLAHLCFVGFESLSFAYRISTFV